MEVRKLEQKAWKIREKILDCAYEAGNCHVGGALSTVELLTALYYWVMKIDPQSPEDPLRDRFILSKGHGVLGLYVILADLGFFSSEQLKSYKKMDSILQGHPDARKTPGIEMSAGSLGQGISYGVGKALALKLKENGAKVFVMVGDGELQEGQNWEAISSAAHYQLDNLIVIVDQNRLQLDGPIEAIQNHFYLKERFCSFGWEVWEIDGHNMEAILEVLGKPAQGRPRAIIANTIKGKGVSFLENQVSSHCCKISSEQYSMIKKELSNYRREVLE